MRFFFFLLLVLFSFSSNSQTLFYKEKFRPQYHFTPPIHWTNDPNGLVYHNGKYHLFYQYNPFGIRWGHMSWGHAVSTDLVYWEHLPLAIPEEKDTMIFSGTCVVDSFNSTAFAKQQGQIPLVAIYTAHVKDVGQSQHIAYSLDDGLTWEKYNKNPVLDIGSTDFRDPQVFWYSPDKKWVMCVVLALEKKIQFYSSPDLKQWKWMSDFGPAGDTTGIWECPDLFRVPIDGKPGKSKWVLMHSPAPYMQYFVGEFDGTAFRNENPPQKIFRPDYGPDYYAGITYKNLPVGSSPISIGWANNWNYAQDIPTSPWRSTMSLPRKLSVKKINGEWILIQRPVVEFDKIKKLIYKDFKVGFEKVMKLPTPSSQQYEVAFSLNPGAGATGGIRIGTGDDHYLEFGWDAQNNLLYLDRSKTANQSFSSSFSKMNRFEIPYIPGGPFEVRVYVDHSLAEFFVTGGERVFTAQFFPTEKDTGIELFSTHKNAAGVGHCRVYEIKSTW